MVQIGVKASWDVGFEAALVDYSGAAIYMAADVLRGR
jgi:hypothetical protein